MSPGLRSFINVERRNHGTQACLSHFFFHGAFHTGMYEKKPLGALKGARPILVEPKMIKHPCLLVRGWPFHAPFIHMMPAQILVLYHPTGNQAPRDEKGTKSTITTKLDFFSMTKLTENREVRDKVLAKKRCSEVSESLCASQIKL